MLNVWAGCQRSAEPVAASDLLFNDQEFHSQGDFDAQRPNWGPQHVGSWEQTKKFDLTMITTVFL